MVAESSSVGKRTTPGLLNKSRDHKGREPWRGSRCNQGCYLDPKGGDGVGGKQPGFSPPPASGLSSVSPISPNSFLGGHVTLAEPNRDSLRWMLRERISLSVRLCAFVSCDVESACLSMKPERNVELVRNKGPGPEDHLNLGPSWASCA